MEGLLKKIFSLSVVLSLAISFNPIAQAEEVLPDPEFMAFVAALYDEPLVKAEFKLDEFADKLKVTQAQQPLWQVFKAQVIEQLSAKQQRALAVKERVIARSGMPLTAVEALKFRQMVLQNQMDDTVQMLQAVEPLYFSFDDRQRRQFDHVMRSVWFKKRIAQRTVN